MHDPRDPRQPFLAYLEGDDGLPGHAPNLFIYVHTPKHGSWLNLIEMAFSKMARSFLRRIRVRSRDKLKQRILKDIAEINESPTVMRWRKFDLGVL